jgi:hypothetical protein
MTSRTKTILDILKSAKSDFAELGRIVKNMGPKTSPLYLNGLDQLNKAIDALEGGKNPHDIINPK